MQNQDLPWIDKSANISLTSLETALIQKVHLDYAKVILEREFGGGYSGTRVFLVMPVYQDHTSDARVVTKIGPAEGLRHEFENYQKYASRALPFTTAQVRDFYEQDGWAALNYVFVGGADLGKSLSLEDYYHAHSAEEVINTLKNLFEKALGPGWYGQAEPLTCRFRDEYGHHLPLHQDLEEIVQKILPAAISSDGTQITIAGVADSFPNPLHHYSNLLDKTLKGRKSFVHGDLHLRNVLVDEGGKAWLIDFAKLRKRHNLFDFIKMEIYIRLMALSSHYGAFSLSEYVYFERSLNAAAMDQSAQMPSNSKLKFAYQVILAIRTTARNYLVDPHGFKQEYLSALFLYALAMMKYYPTNGDVLTRLLFVTTCVCAQGLLKEEVMTPKNDTVKQQKKKTSPGKSSGSRQVDTGGGIYIEGNVTTNGDFVGRDQYKITGPSMHDISQLFEIFYAAVEARPNTSPSDKSDLKAELKEVEKEVAKGNTANEDFLSRRLRNIKRMAPDILDVVLTTFARPVSGLALVVRKLAEKMKTDAGSGDKL